MSPPLQNISQFNFATYAELSYFIQSKCYRNIRKMAKNKGYSIFPIRE